VDPVLRNACAPETSDSLGTSIVGVPASLYQRDNVKPVGHLRPVTYLSGVLLVGLLLNLVFGRYWADPIVALVIAAAAIREGREARRGQECC
jgi:hypothetical protein